MWGKLVPNMTSLACLLPRLQEFLPNHDLSTRTVYWGCSALQARLQSMLQTWAWQMKPILFRIFLSFQNQGLPVYVIEGSLTIEQPQVSANTKLCDQPNIDIPDLETESYFFCRFVFYRNKTVFPRFNQNIRAVKWFWNWRATENCAQTLYKEEEELTAKRFHKGVWCLAPCLHGRTLCFLMMTNKQTTRHKMH